ncbi:hypothetical protein DCAR_0622794 [Daucus carota subsp. sativus]|uniref:Uncharacterized protein n=1 Tax=Daucus carota subsp. sativus TaxID=79200 RepID=A0A164UVL8_DAUCS|nr:PREDICTED: uncharacterized protein LOC108224786 [Daucus carota subsp. sativus]WOH03397.1 hypothetical protein DCAR_0622794 [Daucus carota subsp. sativus]
MCSEMLPLITSPRISFSHDLNIEEDDEQVEVKMEEDQEDSSSMDVSDILDNDHEGQLFDFSFSDSFTFEPSSSSADELFSDGLIRPLQLEEKFVTTSKHASVPPTLSQHSSTNDDPSLLKDANVVATMSTTANVVESSEHKNQNQANSKSFWKINRSSSVHVDEDSYKKSSFWSLPLMLRSNSTGSAPSPRQMSKENKKHNMQKQLKCSTASSSSFYMYQLSQKPPLKRNHGGSYGNNGVFTNPVLNVPPPYIGKGTGNLFGITSLFKEKKDKKIKK